MVYWCRQGPQSGLDAVKVFDSEEIDSAVYADIMRAAETLPTGDQLRV
jgi:hypothetical protein